MSAALPADCQEQPGSQGFAFAIAYNANWTACFPATAAMASYLTTALASIAGPIQWCRVSTANVVQATNSSAVTVGTTVFRAAMLAALDSTVATGSLPSPPAPPADGLTISLDAPNGLTFIRLRAGGSWAQVYSRAVVYLDGVSVYAAGWGNQGYGWVVADDAATLLLQIDSLQWQDNFAALAQVDLWLTNGDYATHENNAEYVVVNNGTAAIQPGYSSLFVPPSSAGVVTATTLTAAGGVA